MPIRNITIIIAQDNIPSSGTKFPDVMLYKPIVGTNKIMNAGINQTSLKISGFEKL